MPAPTAPLRVTTNQEVCDTHTWMRGFVVASVDRAEVSAADGSFRIDEVPPGTYELSFWHEVLEGSSQTVTVPAGAVAEVQVDFRPAAEAAP
ncbi:MAG: hypothetical protein CL471_14725 [Acidobacteria bacterium]|nr:hypothetical protein [Acidobacteriota bacterium]